MNNDAAVWSFATAVVPTLLWVVMVLVALSIFRKQIADLVLAITRRVRTGASFKVAQFFEVGASIAPAVATVLPGGTDFVSGGAAKVSNRKGRPDLTRLDKNEELYRAREQRYEQDRCLFLVHRLYLAKNPTQLYDVMLYLIPRREGTLASVRKVEYYFGRHWGDTIYTIDDRNSGFAIVISAYSSTLCTAKIYFTDECTTRMWRYLDFEMGPIGTDDPSRP